MEKCAHCVRTHEHLRHGQAIAGHAQIQPRCWSKGDVEHLGKLYTDVTLGWFRCVVIIVGLFVVVVHHVDVVQIGLADKAQRR